LQLAVPSHTRQVTVPTLIVRAGRSDLLTLSSAQEFAALVPGENGRVKSVKCAGHMVAGDKNDEFNGVIWEFLAAQ
jgi:pimeloyl-ACP methyl ester carboxylesterase